MDNTESTADKRKCTQIRSALDYFKFIHCFVEYLKTNTGTGNRQKGGLDIRLLPGSVQNLCELVREASKLWRSTQHCWEICCRKVKNRKAEIYTGLGFKSGIVTYASSLFSHGSYDGVLPKLPWDTITSPFAQQSKCLHDKHWFFILM